MIKKNKTPWPTKAIMKQIYEKHLWGGQGFDFYSGEGSHNLEIVNPYLHSVINFLNSHHEPLTICDLGCGDFNIGKSLVSFSKKYIGVDIVESLIKRNKARYNFENLELHCLDIAKEELPKADCVIIRQVFQHLSNTEITVILKKLYQYKYLILTEHLPTGDFTPNKDIISGQGIRLKHQSGVDLLTEPFNFKIKNEIILNEVFLNNQKEVIKTVCYTLS